MAFELLCHGDDIAPGAMLQRSAADGSRVLVVRLDDGTLRAYQAACPHAGVPLAQGTIDDDTLTCREHWWQFDAATGEGTNPVGCRLAAYPLRETEAGILVDVDGVTPFKAGRSVS